MASREIIEESITPDGEALTLTREAGGHAVRVRGALLMSSRLCGSEQAMAKLAFSDDVVPDRARVLVAGLGMGYTLRALLDRVGKNARVDVIELLDDVVRWNRGPLAAYADHPLDDPRVHLSVGDLLDYLTTARHVFDAILIDIDNGPEAFTVKGNALLYDPTGLAALYDATAKGGVIVVWSAFQSPPFEKRLRKAGFTARSVTVRARPEVRKGSKHTLFVAVRPAKKQS